MATLNQYSGRKARPIIKSPGGKAYLKPTIARILNGFPAGEHTYLEPMVGGGSVLIAFGQPFAGRAIGDLNPELINLYRVVQSEVEALIAELSNGGYFLRHKGDPATRVNYLRIRASASATPVEKAARLLYLLKTCFNGLMRTNRAGGFNTAMGSYQDPLICDSPALRACAAFLADTHIFDPGDAATLIAAHGDPGRFLFVDPPYHHPGPANGGKFTGFSGNEFGEAEQGRLVKAVLDSGSPFIYTNRASEFILDLFVGSGARLDRQPLTHSIQPIYTGSANTNRKPEEELIAYRL